MVHKKQIYTIHKSMPERIPVHAIAVMGSEKLVLFRFVCVLLLLAFMVCTFTTTVRSQALGCSIQGIDITVCLNQTNSSISIDNRCCNELNKVMQIGYNCLCMLVSSSLPQVPLFSSPLLLPLLNCFVSIPPLTLCRVLAPMPIVLPQNTSSNNLSQVPSMPSADELRSRSPPPPTLEEMQVPLNSSSDDNRSTTVAIKTPSNENVVPRVENTQNRRDKTTTLMIQIMLLSFAFHGHIMLA